MERTLKNFMETLPQGVVATHVVYVDGKQVYNGDDLIYAMDHCDMLREEEPSTVTTALVTLYHKVEARNWASSSGVAMAGQRLGIQRRTRGMRITGIYV